MGLQPAVSQIYATFDGHAPAEIHYSAPKVHIQGTPFSTWDWNAGARGSPSQDHLATLEIAWSFVVPVTQSSLLQSIYSNK